MRILAFDCAGAQCAAAAVTDGRVVAQRRIQADRGHAGLLLPLLCAIMAEAGLAFAEIDRYAVTTGPGSFTGIRVALAAAHGLSLATGAPIVGINVFEALAAAAVEAGVTTPRLLVAVESKRADFFVQLFDPLGAAIGAAAMVAPGPLAAWAGPGPVTLVGDAAGRVAPFLPGAVVNPKPAAAVDPATLALIARCRGTGAPPVPFYLRPPDAALPSLPQ